jgi:glycosyltransferase involved in cell wall biosynthesis
MPTFRRPEGLARAVPVILDQVHALDGQARLVVVDNDPDGGAAPLAARLGSLDTGLHYVLETRPGIAAARNRALDAAYELGAHALVFIDDDEVPEPGWLNALVTGWATWGCAAVTGPVTSVFEGPADEWVRASGMFDRTERVSGSVNPGASSANLLLDLRVLRSLGIRFDEDFGLSGGSDTMLMHRLREMGGDIRWCQEAGVTEYVPASRSQHVWVVNRTIRTSNTWSRVAMRLAAEGSRTWRTRAEMTARGAYRLARGSARWVFGRLSRQVRHQARGAVDAASGLGIILGAYGVVRYEYRRTAFPVKPRSASTAVGPSATA